MTIQHPDDKHLQGYVAARLAEEQAKIIEKHLARCPECSKRVSELENLLQDPLLQKVKAAAASDDDSSGTVAAVVRSSQVNQSVSNVTVSGKIVPGDILGGNLRLEEKLGRGGMGETWKAYDLTAERFVVLKFVPGELQHLKEAMDSVRSSFQKIHALQHQHICPVYSLIDDPKHGLYIVMKYIDGMTLSEYRRRLADKKSKMSFNDIVQILWAVAKGLDYAHERKVIHRDIKPGNIMIGRKDGVQIIDFGLAEEIRTLMSQASDSVAMSSSGTRPYMAPEQWQGRIQDARTDQYALAVTAYELFAGHVPFSGNDIELLKNTVVNDTPESIAGLPEYANAALLKALSKKRDERYENCRAFVKALVTKPATTDSKEIEERNFPDGAVSVNDLPSDQASGEKAPPAWIPVGLSALPSTSSSTLKPPIFASNSAMKKKSLPSWVGPTISALAMLVLCLFFFLGYVMKDKESKPAAKPEKPIAVAKKQEPKDERIVEPETDAKKELQPITSSFKSGFKNIFEAAAKGTVDDVRCFIDMNTDINTKNKSGRTALHEAALYNRNVEVLKCFIFNGADVNAKEDIEGNTPLHAAARSNGNVQVLEYLVSQGADLNAKNKDGRLPRHFAAADNPSIEVLKYFISQGVDINAKNYAGRTMLHEAALFNRHVEILKYLVSQGADVNAKSGPEDNTPLHEAARSNSNVEILKYLVSQGADLNAKNKDGRLPRHLAAADNPSIEVLKFFLSQGVDIHEKRTMLHEAALFNRNVEVLKYLVSQGADLNAKTHQDWTTLHHAARKNPEVKVWEYLVSLVADVNVKSRHGETPLHDAARYNRNPEVLKYLISQGGDVNVKDKNGKTPLDVANTEEKKTILRAAMEAKTPPTPSPSGLKNIFEAASKGTVQDIEHFLKNGVDINAKKDDGSTALHTAVWDNRSIDILEYLISKGADVNARKNDGRAPLHVGAQNNPNVTVLKYLVSQGGDIHAKSNAGHLPQDYAAAHNSAKVVEYFISQGADINAKNYRGMTLLHEAVLHNRHTETLTYLISRGGDVHAKNRDGKTPLEIAKTEEMKTILREAMEPVEAGKLRRQFEEAIKQAQTPYREELEKELALAKKQDKSELVAALEAEQKHLDSEDAIELSTFTPEKRSLLNAKVRYKKQFETARDAYLKEMDLLAKELVRDARTNDALFVQNEVDRIRNRLNERIHLGEQKLSLIRPKRSQFGPVPVIRMTMELHASGKGRFGISRGMSTDSPEPLFPSQVFPLSAFPKAQAFRGQNGMGRVIWDFRNADPKATWNASGWGGSFTHTEIDSSRLTLRFESSKLEASQPGPRASFLPGKLSDFPVRLTVDAKVNSKGCCPFIYFCMNEKSGEQTYVDMWKPTGASPTDKLVFGAYTRKKPDGSRFKIALPNTELVGNQPVWSLFELPKAAVENVVSIQYMVQAGHERYDLPPRLNLDIEVLLVDISGKLKATTGFAVGDTHGKLRIENVSPRTSAFRAGLKIGDEIVRFNGEKRSAEQIQKTLKEVQFGDPISVVVIRNGEEKVFRFHAE